MRVNGVTAVRRSLERRDLLTLLLAAPERLLREDDFITDDSRRDYTVRRLAAHLNGDNMNIFPGHELHSILHALAEECRASGSVDQPPLKKASRRPVNNNLHSILRFVERIIRQRYETKTKPHNATDEDFLDDELKRYFGVKDLSFQIEEGILSLAFGIALDAVVQSVEGAAFNSTSSSDDDIVSGKRLISEVPPVPIIIPNNLPSEDIIKTALRIIDSAVLINRCMRAKLEQLQKAREKSEACFNDDITDKIKRYEHLLKPKKRRHDNRRNRSKHAPGYAGVVSAMEENHPRQWEWLQRVKRKLNEMESPSEPVAKSASVDVNFVIVRRRIETLDDISVSSNECDDVMHDESIKPDDFSKPDTKEDSSNFMPEPKTELEHVASFDPAPNSMEPTISPFEQLDRETHRLRLVLLDMPPGDSSSTEVVRHTVGEIVSLLGRYGELDGASGITRCGDILGGRLAIDASDDANVDGGNSKQGDQLSFDRFPLNDVTVSSLASTFLTDATGALRANAFLRSFVLPLMIEMNPTARAIYAGVSRACEDDDGMTMGGTEWGKPASRALTTLLTSLSRERPMECVVSVIIPSLVMTEGKPSTSSSSFEPTRFQCELISRVLRGKDALSVQAIAVLVETIVLPTRMGGPIGAMNVSTSYTGGGMKWTESTMPVLTACLNCKPPLTDDVVIELADTISNLLHPSGGTSSSSANTMTKSIKFSTLFHALVVKYGLQLRSARRVEPLLDSASMLRTFISKSICLALRKLS
ncbi:hypothetical protein ACHAXA_011265 [Cyclostephanos tholiformis]|uniref:Uncharacterized protein n=1 Tax=Cyclostephanos tholiformis TaxID=382380 RepID=A0ABD3SPZ7_9STRA